MSSDLEARLSKLRADIEDNREVRDKGFFDYVNEINTGIARFLGIFIDPFTEKQFVQKKMAELGMAHPPGQEGQDFPSRFLQDLGSTVVPLAGQAAAGARIAARGAEAVTPMGKLALETVQRPAAVVGREVAAVAGGAAGGLIAEDIAPDEPWARAIGELIGGLAPGAAGSLVFQGRELIQGQRSIPFGAKRASSRIEKLSERPADENLDDMLADILDLPPAERAGDIGIIRLQKAAEQADPKLAARIAQREHQATEKAKELLLRGGNPRAVKLYLNNLVSAALTEVKRGLNKLQPKLTSREANLVVRSKLQTALEKARTVETRLWNKIPNRRIDPTPIQDEFMAILAKRTPESKPEDVPRYLEKIIGKFDKNRTFSPGSLTPQTRNVIELRKRIMQDIANEQAKKAPNFNKIRILSRVNDAIVRALEASDAGDAARTAIEFSRNLNERFTRGFVGELLGYQKTADVSFLPLDTLQRLEKMTGARGAAAVRQVLAAEPKVRKQVADVVKQGFLNQALDTEGNLVVANAKRFLQRNAELLDEFPEIRAAIEDSVKGKKIADFLLGSRKPIPTSPIRKRVSAASLWLDAPVGQEIKRVIENSPNPRASMRELLRLVSGNREAMAGVRTAIKEYIINKSFKGAPDVDGFRMLSGSEILRTLQDNMAAFKVFLPPSDVQRIKRIAGELIKIERARAAKPAPGGVISDLPGTLLEMAIKVPAVRLGAKLGHKTSGASLLTAHFGSRKAQELLQYLTNDSAKDLLIRAMEEPEVLQVLLTPLSKASPIKKQQIADKAIAWLAGPTATVLGQKSEETTPLEESLEQLRRDISKGIIPDAGAATTNPVQQTMQLWRDSTYTNKIPRKQAIRVAKQMDAEERRLGLPPGILGKIAFQESSFRPNEVSPAGAVGLMQLTPIAIKDIKDRYGVSIDPRDPIQAVRGAALHFKTALSQAGGDVDKALAIYNFGIGNIQKKPLPAETINYVKSITGTTLSPNQYLSASP